MDFLITEEFEGRTLRDFLMNELLLSHKMISRLKSLDNGICVNGNHVTVRYILKQKDMLSLSLSDTEQDVNANVVPTEMPLDIVYEDRDIIVINKAPHVPTHPSHNHYSDSLANGLAYYFKQRNINFVFRSVNRLDADTSGLVLVAKNKDSSYKLGRQIQNGQIKKDYIAILSKHIDPPCGIIEGYIRRKGKSIILRECCDENQGGAYALTKYETICKNESLSIVKASPITGRTHQLRVHFSSVGCPLCDDDLYGCTEDYGIGRHALHAYHLRINHPITNEEMDFYAPVENVPDFLEILNGFEDFSPMYQRKEQI